VWILTGVVGGGVFYQEFDGFSLLSWVLFPVGILLCVAGVFFLSQRDAEAEHVRRAKAHTAESAAGLHIAGAEGAAAPRAPGDEGAPAAGLGTGSCEATPLLGGLPVPPRGAPGDRLDRDDAAALMIASVVRERPVLCTRTFLGLGLRRTTVKGACELLPVVTHRVLTPASSCETAVDARRTAALQRCSPQVPSAHTVAMLFVLSIKTSYI
jgi:hypothetical protein